MIKNLIPITFLSSLLLLTPLKAQATEYWTGDLAEDTLAPNFCVLDYTNLRTSPNFSNNIRAILVPISCGEGIMLSDDEQFALVEFYFINLDETRRYWIHLSQLYYFGY